MAEQDQKSDSQHESEAEASPDGGGPLMVPTDGAPADSPPPTAPPPPAPPEDAPTGCAVLEPKWDQRPPLPERYGGPPVAPTLHTRDGRRIYEEMQRSTRPPHAEPLPAAVYMVLMAVVWALCVQISAADITLAFVASAMSIGVAWSAFLRINPRLVVLEWLMLTAVAYQKIPPLALIWLAAALAGGAMGAWLTRHRAREDDYFFLPVATAAAVFAILFAAGLGGPQMPILSAAGRLMTEARDLFAKNTRVATEEDRQVRDMLAAQFPLVATCFMTVLWMLSAWVAGRIARLTTRTLSPRNAQIRFFRLGQRYIFVLIAGLVFEILSVLLRREELGYASWPLLVACVLGLYVQGIGVVLFMASVQQALGRTGGAIWVRVIGLINPPATVVLGLFDAWRDFRRLDRRRTAPASKPTAD